MGSWIWSINGRLILVPEITVALTQDRNLLLKLSKARCVSLGVLMPAGGNRCSMATSYRSLSTAALLPTTYLSAHQQRNNATAQCLTASRSRSSQCMSHSWFPICCWKEWESWLHLQWQFYDMCRHLLLITIRDQAIRLLTGAIKQSAGSSSFWWWLTQART